MSRGGRLPAPLQHAGPALLPLLGMRDLLPPAAAARRALGRRLLEVMARHGYELVTTPAIESEAVLELGLATVGGSDLIRLVEPDTGEVAAVRSDMTPQIARIVATRLRDRPAPWRLCYEGSVVRRRRGRARRHRQIAQAGVELIGVEGPAGDVEVIRLALATLHAAGLDRVHVELGHVGLAAAALEGIADPAARAEVAAALGRKDVAEVQAQAASAGATRATIARLCWLAESYGDETVLRDAARKLRDPRSTAALRTLREAHAALAAQGGAELGVDLGEVRGQGYYGGISFQLLADGPGEPLGAGGRYDGVLARFGLPPLPATGFALDLDNVEWAIDQAGTPTSVGLVSEVRVVLAGEPVRAAALAARLRDAGATATTRTQASATARRARSELLEYARAWRFDAAVLVGASAVEVTWPAGGAAVRLAADATAHDVLAAVQRQRACAGATRGSGESDETRA